MKNFIKKIAGMYAGGYLLVEVIDRIMFHVKWVMYGGSLINDYMDVVWYIETICLTYVSVKLMRPLCHDVVKSCEAYYEAKKKYLYGEQPEFKNIVLK